MIPCKKDPIAWDRSLLYATANLDFETLSSYENKYSGRIYSIKGDGFIFLEGFPAYHPPLNCDESNKIKVNGTLLHLILLGRIVKKEPCSTSFYSWIEKFTHSEIDINEKNENGLTPLQIACKGINSSEELICIKSLLASQADPTICCSLDESPIRYFDHDPPLRKEVKKLFRLYKTDYEEHLNRVLLHKAIVASDEKKILKLLPNFELDSVLNPSNNYNLLNLLLLTGSENVINAVLERKPSLNGSNASLSNEHPLLIALRTNNLDLLKKLLKCGADPNFLTHKFGGYVPLWFEAAIFSTPPFFNELLSGGVDIAAKASQGYSITDIMQPYKNEQLLKYFLNEIDQWEKEGAQDKCIYQTNLHTFFSVMRSYGIKKKDMQNSIWIEIIKEECLRNRNMPPDILDQVVLLVQTQGSYLESILKISQPSEIIKKNKSLLKGGDRDQQDNMILIAERLVPY